ncbi:MAG: NAD(P)H-dependent oxidoreductase [Paramuribaculum sp.]|nr:NAD(P)H-dependent oxidoreductase [Paramuribaculum sp.]
MMTIIYAHPNPDSFNHSILKAVTDTMEAEGREYRVIDLYADGFNPVMSAKELELYAKGEADDALVQKYAVALQDSDRVMFIFPVWWGMMPAMLKGFFDKVFLKGRVYDTTDTGDILPCLSVSRTYVVTTSDGPSAEFGNFFEGYLNPVVFQAVGMNGAQWFNCERTDSTDPVPRQEFVQSLLKVISQ